MTTPAEAAEATTAILESGAIMLGAALVSVTIFRKLKLGATLGYIVAGAIIGPQLLGLIRDPAQLTSVTEIGIALLLFIVGLELQPRRLWRLRRDIFGLGLAQVVLCGLAISALIYFALGLSPEASLAIGLPLGLSSTAQVLPMLRSDNDLNTPQGERAFSILLFQDLSIVPLITIVAAMSRVPPDPSEPSGWTMALYTVLAVAGLVLVGRLVLNPLFRLIGRFGERELFVVAGLFTVVGVALAVIAVKSVLIAGLARLFGNNWPRSIRLGLLLSQAGEFGFVLFGMAAAGQIVTPEAASLFGAVVTLSMASTPFLMRLTDWLERREGSTDDLDGPEMSPDTPIIIVGYGRFGQTVGQMLMAKSVPVTLVDKDAEMIEAAGSFGTKVYFGDGTRIDLLRTAGADQARAILFCNDNQDGGLTREALARVLEAFPQAQVMVRTFDRRHMIELDGLDLAYTQRELFESAIKMGRAALRQVGIDAAEVDRVDDEYRLRDCERLERQASTGDLRAGLERSFGPDRALPDEEQPTPA